MNSHVSIYRQLINIQYPQARITMRLRELFEAAMPDHLPPGEESSLEVDEILEPGEEKLDALKSGEQKTLGLKFTNPQSVEDEIQNCEFFMDRAEKDIAQYSELLKDTNVSQDQQDRYRDYIQKAQNDFNKFSRQKDKLKKSLTAGLSARSKNQLDDILYTVESHCRLYLRQVNLTTKWLYRGMDGAKVAFIGRSRDNRRTRDSNSMLQPLFDQQLQECGMSALRSNSIFATSDLGHATEFGDIYIIFPIDNRYKYTYTNQHDITLQDIDQVINPESTHKFIRGFIPALRASNLSQDLKDRLTVALYNNFLSFLYIIDKNKAALLKSGIPEQTITLAPDVKWFRQTYKPRNKDLATAMKNGLEVYISGEYYAFSYSIFGNAIKEHFGMGIDQ
jgi:hypothetical protein